METVKKLSNKYTSLTLGTWVALLMTSGITSCTSCDNSKEAADNNGKVQVSASSTVLQPDEKEVTLSFKLTNEGEMAKLADFKLKVKVEGGPGKIKYTVKGTDKWVTAGTEGEESLADILTKDDGMLGAGDVLPMKVIFEPETTAIDMIATFQVIDTTDENKVISEIPAIKWSAAVVDSYTLTLDRNNIDDGIKEVKVTVKKGTTELQAADLAKLKLKIKRISTGVAKIEGIDNGILALKGTHVLTLAVDNKLASKKLTINPGTDKKATFELLLADDEGEITASKQTLEWSHGIHLVVNKLAYDHASTAVHYSVTNQGKVEAMGLKLIWARKDKVGNVVKINNLDKGEVAILSLQAGKTAPGNLPVDWGTDQRGEFEFKLFCGAEEIVTRKLSLSKSAPEVTINLKEGKAKFTGVNERQVTFTITAGSKELTKKDLKLVQLEYTAINGQELEKEELLKNFIARDGNLYELLGVNTLKANETRELVLIINNKNQNKAIFTDIKLQGSKDEATNKVAQIEWETEKLNVKISSDDTNTTLTGLGAKAKIKITNNSVFKLEKKQLSELTIQYTATGGKEMLKKGKNDVNGKNLWDLLNKPIDPNTTEELELGIGSDTASRVEFTNIKLEGSEDKAVITKIEWEKGKIKVKLADTSKQGLSAGKKEFELEFVNESGFDLTETDLNTIKIELSGTTPDKLVDEKSKIITSGTTTLAEILGKKPRLKKSGKTKVKFTLTPNASNDSCDFKIKLTGNNSAAIEKQITWQP